MRFQNRSIYSLAVLIALTVLFCSMSCSDDEATQEEFPFHEDGIFIVNEGNFNSGNSSLSFYSFDKNRIYNGLFEKWTGQELGDVAQSMVIEYNMGYIVVNNSDKIEMIRITDGESQGTIELEQGFSPRDIVFTTYGEKAYISSLYQNKVAVIDMDSLTVSGTIPVGNNPEEMELIDGKLYVANSGFGSGNSISVIDTESDTVIGEIAVGDNPVNLEYTATLTSGTHLVILCHGSYNDFDDPNDDTPGQLAIYDISSESIIHTRTIDGHPTDLAVNYPGVGYYILNNKVVSFSVSDCSVINDSLIVVDSGALYSLEAQGGRIFVGNAMDFVSNGKVTVYDEEGVQLFSANVGVNPGAFAFVGWFTID
ncbi:MAG: hypothetical protein B6244_04340 [Candidatus Cloacimonetes bacterium 4572_55]|nr:MAG: hypothetical protein B6244_04340 [Candidatus Cloacimonetes bacterium 4572_55]